MSSELTATICTLLKKIFTPNLLKNLLQFNFFCSYEDTRNIMKCGDRTIKLFKYKKRILCSTTLIANLKEITIPKNTKFTFKLYINLKYSELLKIELQSYKYLADIQIN
jgi:hypothetical protein